LKQTKISEYRPKYPKKLIKGAILATAAAVALAGTTGCESVRTGGEPGPVPTDELVLDGETMIDPGLDDNLMEPGEPAVDENGEIIMDEEPEGRTRDGEEPALMGKIVVPTDMP
jgi:hypothetical protein